MIINNNILKLSNVHFDNKFFVNNIPNDIDVGNFISNYSTDEYTNINNKNVIEIDNLLVIKTLHSCFSHAIIDCCFPYFWAINDIKEYDTDVKDIYLFIKKKEILAFKEQNLPLIDSNTRRYNGVYHDIISFVSDNYIFEHLLDDKTTYSIKNCYFYSIDDKWQRSVWNSVHYYPNRRVCLNIKDALYTDEQIYYQLNNFVRYVKNKYNISTNNIVSDNNAIIIERKYNRFFDKSILNNIIDNVKKNKLLKYQGVKILEDLTLSQQIQLFSESNIFIFRHGSCLINLLWIPNNSIIFDIDIYPFRRNIVRRIAKLTNSRVYSVAYQNIDYNMFCNESLFR